MVEKLQIVKSLKVDVDRRWHIRASFEPGLKGILLSWLSCESLLGHVPKVLSQVVFNATFRLLDWFDLEFYPPFRVGWVYFADGMWALTLSFKPPIFWSIIKLYHSVRGVEKIRILLLGFSRFFVVKDWEFAEALRWPRSICLFVSFTHFAQLKSWF